ncbi:hypothetical protein [Alloacidobacterium dinghuense]|nr:hypothetical protein [Alloacidobacterium dinghuense]
MEQTPNTSHPKLTQRRKAADYVYQAATVAAALLLLLTATV